MDFNQTVAFITGAARGLGRGFSEAVLERGGKVVLADVDVEAGTRTLQELEERFSLDKVKFVPLDVTNQEQFKDAFNWAVSTFGHVNLMVNNAGIYDESRHDLEINVNFRALVFGTYLAHDHMRRDKGGKGGRVINISSAVGLVDSLHAPVYSATKHAVRAFTISLAKQPNIPELGLELAVLCPEATVTNLLTSLDEGKIHFLELAKAQYQNYKPMSISTVVDAFLELVTLPQMNGSILLVEPKGVSYRNIENNPV